MLSILRSGVLALAALSATVAASPLPPLQKPSLTAPYGVLVVSELATGPSYAATSPVDQGQGQMQAQFANFLIVAYHTGAGLNNAVAYNGTPKAVRAWFDASTGSPQFEIGTGANGIGSYTKPFGFYHSYTDTYAAWGPVQINAGPGKDVYRYDHTGAGLVGAWDDFGGWLVCDWSLQVPQLFWAIKGRQHAIPETCAPVSLHYRCLDPTTGVRRVPEPGEECYTQPVPRAN